MAASATCDENSDGSTGAEVRYYVPGNYKLTSAGAGDTVPATAVHSVLRDVAEEKEVVDGIQDFCGALKVDLEARFYESNGTGGFNIIISALSKCFDFRTYPLNAEGQLLDPVYGDDEMKLIISFFGGEIHQHGGVTSSRIIHPTDAEVE
jgi:hypothetical protein